MRPVVSQALLQGALRGDLQGLEDPGVIQHLHQSETQKRSQVAEEA